MRKIFHFFSHATDSHIELSIAHSLICAIFHFLLAKEEGIVYNHRIVGEGRQEEIFRKKTFKN